jgi:hypothetical protein
MIWTDTHNVSPGNTLVGTYTIDGTMYHIYAGTGGDGPAMWFVQATSTTSQTTHVLAVLDWACSHGFATNPTVSLVQFGWEIWGTDGSQAFTMHSYSLTTKQVG